MIKIRRRNFLVFTCIAIFTFLLYSSLQIGFIPPSISDFYHTDAQLSFIITMVICSFTVALGDDNMWSTYASPFLLGVAFLPAGPDAIGWAHNICALVYFTGLALYSDINTLYACLITAVLGILFKVGIFWIEVYSLIYIFGALFIYRRNVLVSKSAVDKYDTYLPIILQTKKTENIL
jgi:hypothetical protein